MLFSQCPLKEESMTIIVRISSRMGATIYCQKADGSSVEDGTPLPNFHKIGYIIVDGKRLNVELWTYSKGERRITFPSGLSKLNFDVDPNVKTFGQLKVQCEQKRNQ